MNGRHSSRLITSIVSVFVLTLAPMAFADSAVVGDWDMVMDFNGTDVPGKMTITEGDGGALAGTWTAEGETRELKNVAFEGGKLTFARDVTYEGADYEITYEGTLDGDALTGKFTTGMGDLTTNGTRGGAATPSLTGTWKLMVSSQLGDNERTLTVKDDMTALYNFDGQDFEVKDLKVEGDAVTFDVTPSAQGQELALSFVGKLDGDKLTGEFHMDGSAVAQITGERAGASAGGSLPAGEYALTVDSQIGEFHHKLTVKDDGTAVYESDGTESAITNLVVDGESVSFNVTVTASGQAYDLEFEGTFEDGKFDGEYLMDGGPVADVYTSTPDEA